MNNNKVNVDILDLSGGGPSPDPRGISPEEQMQMMEMALFKTKFKEGLPKIGVDLKNARAQAALMEIIVEQARDCGVNPMSVLSLVAAVYNGANIEESIQRQVKNDGSAKAN